MGSSCSAQGLGDPRGPDPDFPEGAASLHLLCSREGLVWGWGLAHDQGQSSPASAPGIPASVGAPPWICRPVSRQPLGVHTTPLEPLPQNCELGATGALPQGVTVWKGLSRHVTAGGISSLICTQLGGALWWRPPGGPPCSPLGPASPLVLGPGPDTSRCPHTRGRGSVNATQ